MTDFKEKRYTTIVHQSEVFNVIENKTYKKQPSYAVYDNTTQTDVVIIGFNPTSYKEVEDKAIEMNIAFESGDPITSNSSKELVKPSDEIRKLIEEQQAIITNGEDKLKSGITFPYRQQLEYRIPHIRTRILDLTNHLETAIKFEDLVDKYKESCKMFADVSSDFIKTINKKEDLLGVLNVIAKTGTEENGYITINLSTFKLVKDIINLNK